jgi:hypothetical protein
MKPFFLVLALTLTVAMSVPPSSGADVPTTGASPSMIEKVQSKPPRKRGSRQCYSDCVKEFGCALDIIGQCYAHCSCACNAKTPVEAKKCPDPT